MYKGSSALTLIELIVVLAIIELLTNS